MSRLYYRQKLPGKGAVTSFLLFWLLFFIVPLFFCALRVNNTATLSNLQFGAGGAAAGSPTTTGGESGHLSGTVILGDSSFFNEFIQRSGTQEQSPHGL